MKPLWSPAAKCAGEFDEVLIGQPGARVGFAQCLDLALCMLPQKVANRDSRWVTLPTITTTGGEVSGAGGGLYGLFHAQHPATVRKPASPVVDSTLKKSFMIPPTSEPYQEPSFLSDPILQTKRLSASGAPRARQVLLRPTPETCVTVTWLNPSQYRFSGVEVIWKSPEAIFVVFG